MKNKIYRILVPILQKTVNNRELQYKIRYYSKKYLGNHLGKYLMASITAVLLSQGLLNTNVTTEHFKQYTEPVSNIVEFEKDVFNGSEIEEIPEAVSGNTNYSPSKKLKTWGDKKGLIEYERTRKQNRGTCVYESYDMLTIRSLQHLGLEPVDSGKDTFIDIKHSYWDKVYNPMTDTGEVPLWAFKKFQEKGLPIKYSEQFSQENRLSGNFSNWGKSINENVKNLTQLKAPFKLEKKGYGADGLFKELEKWEGKDFVYRVSIKNFKRNGNYCVDYYFTEFPRVKDMTGCTVTGGHSVVGIDEVGVFEFNGKPSIALRTSTGSKYKRIIDLDTLRVINTTWEIYTPIGDTGNVTVAPEPVVENLDYKILSTTAISYGDSGEYVKALQRFLKVTVDGKFGNGTRIALRNWQYKVFGRYYSGKYWGAGSIRKYKTLQK